MTLNPTIADVDVSQSAIMADWGEKSVGLSCLYIMREWWKNTLDTLIATV